MTIMVFDIETVPDFIHGRKILGLEDASDQEVVKALLALRRNEKGHDFLPCHLHKVVAISVVLRTPEEIKVLSLGTLEDDEPALIQQFFKGIDHYTPTLVSWNGSGFDLPVLHHRALVHGIQAFRYWDSGKKDPDFKWNNYLGRYHERHTDLMDVLAGYQARAYAPLEEIAILCGLPGKMGFSGDQVLENYWKGHLEAIRNYCETDVLNTYLLYLRFQLMRGHLKSGAYEEECDSLRSWLSHRSEPHLQEFLSAWEVRS